MSEKNFHTLSEEEQDFVGGVLALYELPDGERHILRNTVGYVNKTFVVQAGKQKFVLRKSSALTTLEHLEFEVEVLRYLDKCGYELSPRLLPNREGRFLTNFRGGYWMVQNCIPGEIRASWNNVARFEGEMLKNFFRASAE